MRLREDKIALYNYQKGGCSEGSVHLISQITADRRLSKGLILCQEKFRLDNRKNFFMEGLVRHWNRLLSYVMGLASLKVFKRHVDILLRVKFNGKLQCCQMESDLIIYKVFSYLKDSMILQSFLEIGNQETNQQTNKDFILWNNLYTIYWIILEI